jgi:hypothetical protein
MEDLQTVVIARHEAILKLWTGNDRFKIASSAEKAFSQ